ncbi:prostatic acid phosphatase isoform X4 [Lagenorhynchus albirostris]|uniref:prostatic acid phosphatase isoform X4 n=1 Tax=Lagenorhynchus albirostris TaxID=27610 RepID=UPI0028F0DADE|nr:prostatic acid phosphatase isoform X4 [Lagenorhynchus albirostris]
MRAATLLVARAASLRLSLLLSFWLDRGVGAKELRFVTLVFRHGDRSPIETFPNDPIKESSWPQGFGQLTQLGMEQHYELGQYIRKRYEKFLNKSYKHEQVFVRSTDIDRALMSAMTNLAALFPPEGISVWNPSLPWQPIPVHTVPVSEDRGVHNFTLPSWATEDTMTKLKEISELSLLSLYGIHRQKEKSRLQGGVLVKEILYHMKSATQPLNHRKLIIYSAHDTTVSALQMALDVYNGILPPHASCHLTELYFEKGEYFIEMYYRNETQHEPHPLTLPGCTPSCPLTKFAELVAPVISQDWSTECAMSNHEGPADRETLWKHLNRWLNKGGHARPIPCAAAFLSDAAFKGQVFTLWASPHLLSLPREESELTVTQGQLPD